MAASFVSNIIVKKVIELFQKHKSFRDDRLGTIEYIVSIHFRAHYGISIISDYRLMADIDRAFRLVQ